MLTYREVRANLLLVGGNEYPYTLTYRGNESIFMSLHSAKDFFRFFANVMKYIVCISGIKSDCRLESFKALRLRRRASSGLSLEIPFLFLLVHNVI